MGPPGSSTLVALTVIVLWYASNVGVLLLNKYLLSSISFRQPVFLTLCHMLACCSLAYALSLTRAFPIKPLRSRRQLAKVALLATIFTCTIVLGNASLKYIAVSFSQAVGSSTPLFTALLAFALQGQSETRAVYATLVPIVLGVIVTSKGEPDFSLIGFTACILATAGRALKSVVQAMLMSDPLEKLDPMSLLFYMSSFSVLLLLPATAVLEPTALIAVRSVMAARPGFLWWLLLNSSMAYAVNLTNFMVTKHTSALTLQVLGNMKGVIAAIVSVLIFHNAVTPRGVLGYAITVAGVFAYSEAKRRQRALRAVDSAKSLEDVEAAAERAALIKGGGLGNFGSSGGAALGGGDASGLGSIAISASAVGAGAVGGSGGGALLEARVGHMQAGLGSALAGGGGAAAAQHRGARSGGGFSGGGLAGGGVPVAVA